MANTTNFNWETPDDTDLVKDGAAAIRTLGSAIDTSLVDLKGGTTGQILSKATNTDMDFTWVAQDDSNAIQNAIIDAKGDLIVGTAADTPARLAVGTNGYILTADSAEAAGMKWAAAAGGGGKVLQVVEGSYATQVDNATNTYQNTNVTANITPSSASSKILVIVKQSGYKNELNIENALIVRLMRDSTEIDSAVGFYSASALIMYGTLILTKLDSPNTTSQITYKTQFKNNANTSGVSVQAGSYPSRITLMEIGA